LALKRYTVFGFSYASPSFSPDGKHFVILRECGMTIDDKKILETM
jgi:hypothetical protein